MKYRLAQKAYEGYRNYTGGRSLASGGPIPEWQDLRDDIKDAWAASVVSIAEEIGEEVRIAVENAGYTIRERLGGMR